MTNAAEKIWAGDIENYTISDRIIQSIEDKGGTIYTIETYTDFTVSFEFKLPPGGNSGLAIRYTGEGTPAYAGMCELQILDDTDKKYAELDPRQYHGSAYGMVAAQRGYLKPLGEWNQQTVTVIGSTIEVILNNQRILKADLATVTEFKGKRKKYVHRSSTEGHFGIAGHQSPVAFRNLRIRKIDHAN